MSLPRVVYRTELGGVKRRVVLVSSDGGCQGTIKLERATTDAMNQEAWAPESAVYHEGFLTELAFAFGTILARRIGPDFLINTDSAGQVTEV